jgi:hypothetical protein
MTVSKRRSTPGFHPECVPCKHSLRCINGILHQRGWQCSSCTVKWIDDVAGTGGFGIPFIFPENCPEFIWIGELQCPRCEGDERKVPWA